MLSLCCSVIVADVIRVYCNVVLLHYIFCELLHFAINTLKLKFYYNLQSIILCYPTYHYFANWACQCMLVLSDIRQYYYIIFANNRHFNVTSNGNKPYYRSKFRTTSRPNQDYKIGLLDQGHSTLDIIRVLDMTRNCPAVTAMAMSEIQAPLLSFCY